MKSPQIIKKILIISFLSLFLTGCNNHNDQPPANKYLVSYQAKSTLSIQLIRSILVQVGLGDLKDMANYDIKTYKVLYNTQYLGQNIIASGIIAVPVQINQPIPVVAAHRGTIFAHDEAPSVQPLISGYEIFSSIGFMTVIPDMTGFGSSEKLIHPYYNYSLLSSCSADMIKAGEEFMKEMNIPGNGKLFLFGYSEGGYITMATDKYLEEEGYAKLTITAVAAGAGSYNPAFVMKDIAARTIFTSPSYLAFIIYSYKNYNDWTEPLSAYFNSPYDGIIPSLLDGSKTSYQINSSLNDTLQVLFQRPFLEKINNGQEQQLTSELNKNRVDNWKPNAVVRLYHSRNDQYIPFADSENTYNLMKSRGGNVELVQIPGNSHEEAGLEMVKVVIPWFSTQSGL
jgi:pimeloyl-ACP methyl ester carboxylesterase